MILVLAFSDPTSMVYILRLVVKDPLMSVRVLGHNGEQLLLIA